MPRFHYRPFSFLSLAAFLVIAASATHLAAQVCSVRQVTFTTPGNSGFVVNQSVSLSDTGEYLTFEGSAQGGPTNIDVWSYDVFADNLDRITIGQEGGNTRPNYSGDGTAIVFSDREDWAGNNADLNSEVFLWDRLTDSFAQVTDTMAPLGGGGQAAMSPDAGFIVFSAAAEHAGTPNPDNKAELYRWNRSDGTFQRLTDSSEGSGSPVINSTSSKVLFNSHGNFAGSNPDANRELFQVNLATLAIEQLTDTTGCVNNLPVRDRVLAADDTLVLFESDCVFSGLNPDGYYEVFVLDLVADLVEQVSPPGSNSGFSGTFAGDGRWVGFASADDPTGANPDGSEEAFLYDRSTGSFVQLTDSSDPSENAGAPHMTNDLSVIAFTHRYDPLGTNADREREIFVCLGLGTPIVEIPTLGPGGLSLLGFLVAMLAVAVLRRR